jgi:hypothetical protein
MNCQDSANLLLKATNLGLPFPNFPQLLFDFQQLLKFQLLITEN